MRMWKNQTFVWNVKWCSCYGNYDGKFKKIKKLKIELPCDSAISTSGLYPKELKTESQRDICMTMLLAILFTISKG